MALFSFSNQLRSVIEWENPQAEAFIQAWSQEYDEIKNASKLILKPGEGVVLLYRGAIQAVHSEPGVYEVSSANIPFITTLMKVMQNFESEHKVGVYFYKTAEMLNQRWGTASPIKYADPVYKFPVGLRAFGNFSCKVNDIRLLFTSVLGTRPLVTFSDIRSAVVPRISQPLTTAFAGAGFSYLEIDKNREQLSTECRTRVDGEFGQLGLTLTDFRIEGTDFDDETQERVSTIANVIADTAAAQAAGLSYVQMQQVQALRDAARNEGGAAGVGVGIGAAAALGQQFGQTMFGSGGALSATPPAANPADRMAKLDELKKQGLITEEEYKAKRLEILASI
jgi:membrane protease subunit (stomatin/prohibitin family)